jgi:hypothetical protein
VNDPEKMLRRLLGAAAENETPAEMPFGFDTRVLARLRETAPNGSAVIALFARRVTIMALAVMVLALAGLYGASVSEGNAETTNGYRMVDTAIENNLEE